MTMFKTRGDANYVQTNCRKCGAEMTIGVIALSRLHHPPTCDRCLAEQTTIAPSDPVQTPAI